MRKHLNVWESLLDNAIEQIFVYKEKVLIVKTCKSINFFIQEIDPED